MENTIVLVPRMTSLGLFLWGIALLLISLLISFGTPALYGQQSSELMANLPSPIYTIVSWLSLVTPVVGAAFLAASFVLRRIEADVSARQPEKTLTR